MIEKPVLMNAAASRPIQPHVHLDRDWALNFRAEFAKELTRIVTMGHTYGELTRHYQEATLLTPQETVSRACDIADAFFTEVERRQWLIPTPLYDDAVRELADTVSPTDFMGKSS